MTYTATVPGQVTAYVDNVGGLHRTREGAIESDLNRAIYCACRDIVAPDSKARFMGGQLETISEFVRILIEKNPEARRVILGEKSGINTGRGADFVVRDGRSAAAPRYQMKTLPLVVGDAVRAMKLAEQQLIDLGSDGIASGLTYAIAKLRGLLEDE